MSIEVTNEPWPHIVIEDFLPEGAFNTMRENCMWLFSGNQSLVELEHDDNVQRYPLKRNFLEEYNMEQYLEYFDTRECSDLRILSNFVRTKPNFVHPIHTEISCKILSCVLYITPDANSGTRLFSDSERSNKLEIEWKPNTMVMFAGQDDVTWHDYTSNWNDRYTYNFFFVDGAKADTSKLIP